MLALFALGGLLTYERRRLDPLIELRFFRSVPFSGATVIAVSAFARCRRGGFGAQLGSGRPDTNGLRDGEPSGVVDRGRLRAPVLGLGALTSGQWAEASAERTARLFEEDEQLGRAAA